MTTYAIANPSLDGFLVNRTPFLSTLTMAVPSITGGGSITITPGGPTSTDPAAVGYLWPRGDGTPSAT